MRVRAQGFTHYFASTATAGLLGLFLAASLTSALSGCSADKDDAKKYAEEQAAKNKKKNRGTTEVVTVDVPVRGGVRIECGELFTDVAQFSAGLPNPVEMHQLSQRQQTKRQPGVNAICEFIREGERPSAEEQKKMSAKSERLGVLPGDPYCELRVDCGRPTPKEFESKCRKMPQHSGNRDLGIFACVMTSQRAERDAYRYKFYEPDTGCYIDVLGGPSVTGPEIPTACAKAAIQQITKASIAKYQK